MPEWWGVSGSSCGGTVVRKVEDGREIYVPVLCKRWSCDVCSFYRYCWLVRNIAQAIYEHDLRYFWTLTLSSKGRSAEDSHRELRRAWRRLSRRLVSPSQELEYVWVAESTTSGYAHLHVLLNRRLEHAEVSAAWRDITGDSYVVWVKRLRSSGAARYMAKYVGKEARRRRLKVGGDIGLRCFGRSQGVRFDSFMPQGKGWQVVSGAWQSNAGWLRRHAWVLDDRVYPTPRLVVATNGVNVWLRSWGAPPGHERAP